MSIRLNNDAAADVGITVQQVGATIRPLLAGDTVSYWLGPDGQNYEVNVQLPKDSRRLAADLGNLYLSTTKRGPDGEARMVPLRQVAEIVETTSPQIIKRQELQRRVALYANVEGRPSGDANKEVQAIIKESTLPPGYRFDVGGQAKDMEESFQAALAALGLAVIFIYLILASQFASFTQPFAIMASLPFSLIGVFLALLLTGTTLNLFSMIGFIMLMGLVTKNAILLVDFANRARRAGASLHDSLLQAGQVRLRPIMMTTAAMIGGMLPLALGLGEGGEIQAPMGRAIIGGVITSTLLTLVVVPVLYTYLDALHERRRARREARRAARARCSRAGAGGLTARVAQAAPGASSLRVCAPEPRAIMKARRHTAVIGMDIEQARCNMVEQQIRTWDVLDPDVLDLLFAVRREDFVPAAYRLLAFADLEIPLGSGAKMWPPRMEARVLQELHLIPGETVLEIGTGSGYLTALLAGRGARVTSVEIDPVLAADAKGKLARAGIGVRRARGRRRRARLGKRDLRRDRADRIDSGAARPVHAAAESRWPGFRGGR